MENATTKRIVSKIGKLQDQIRELQMWKESAMVVLKDWDEVWEAAGKPVKYGDSKSKSVREYLTAAITAINDCVDCANGRESEWGDRAENAFNFLHRFLLNGND